MGTTRGGRRLGRVIREMRVARGLSLEELGKLSGTTKGHLSRVETGKVDLPDSRLRSIAKALGVEPSEVHAAAETPVTA